MQVLVHVSSDCDAPGVTFHGNVEDEDVTRVTLDSTATDYGVDHWTIGEAGTYSLDGWTWVLVPD